MEKQNKMQRCQNKCIRFILDLPARHHVTFNEFKKLNYLSVANRVDYITLCNMFNIMNKTSPEYMCSLIENTSHNYNTRQNKNAVRMENVKAYGKHSFFYNGSKLWNKLENNVKLCETKIKFKKSCKKYLMETMDSVYNCDFIYY